MYACAKSDLVNFSLSPHRFRFCVSPLLECFFFSSITFFFTSYESALDVVVAVAYSIASLSFFHVVSALTHVCNESLDFCAICLSLSPPFLSVFTIHSLFYDLGFFALVSPFPISPIT